MASNLSNQSRNVLSKKLMVKQEVIYIFQIDIVLIMLPLFLECYEIIVWCVIHDLHSAVVVSFHSIFVCI